ncbi:hypothetical protein [Amycolatopsis sp. NPDC004378]
MGAGSAPAERICLHVGGTIVLAMPPVDPEHWSCRPAPIRRSPASGRSGSIRKGITYTTVTALRPGGATVSATAHQDEPNGLPRPGLSRLRWLLTITVIA